MRIFLALWLSLLGAQAATITGTVLTRRGEAAATNITFYAVQRPLFGTNTVRPGWSVTTNSASDGTFTLPLLAGDYRVTFGSDTKDQFMISVPESSATYNIVDISTNTATSVFNIPPTNWIMRAASVSAAGKYGFAPTPTAGQHTNFLRGDGTWAAVSSGGSGGTNASTLFVNGTQVDAGNFTNTSSVTWSSSSTNISATVDLTAATNHVTLATNSLETALRATVNTAALTATNSATVGTLTANSNVVLGPLQESFTITFGGADVLTIWPSKLYSLAIEGTDAGTDAGWTNSGSATVFYGSGALLTNIPLTGLTTAVQPASDNLTNWSSIDTSDYTPRTILTNHVGLATNDLNTALWSTIRNATNPPGNPLLPIAGTLYAFGDSQTIGVNASGASYTSGGYLKPEYIWPNMIASNYGRALVVSNFAVGATRLSWLEGNPESHFNTLGQLPVTWDGVAVAMGGWNDLGNETVSDAFWAILRRAYEAWIARLLIDDYGGIAFIGWTRTGTGSEVLPNWTTTGDNNQPSVTMTNASKLPFWRTDFGSPYGQTRWRTRMTADEVTSFTLTGAKSIALFFDSSAQGGTFSVTNNGEYVGTFSTLYASSYSFPLVVWMDDVPATNNLVIYSLTGTNYFLAAGWVTPKTIAPNRTVVMASMTANTAAAAQRTTTNLWKANKAMESAVAAFSARHPVYFANVYNSYVQSTDQETGGGDISHFTPTGNLHISESFARAYRPTGAPSSNAAPLVELVGPASISYVNASTNGFATTTFANSVTNNAALMRTDANNIVTGSNYVQGLNLGGTWRTTWPSSGTNASTVFVGGVSVDAPNFSNGTHVAFAVADSTNVSATLSGVAFAESNNVLHGSLLLTNTLDDAAVPLIIGAHDIQNANLLEVYTSGAGAPGFAVTAGAELHGNATGLTNFSGNVGAWGGLTTNTLSSIWIDAGAMRTNSAGGPSVFYLLATNNLAPCLDAWAFDSTTPETNYFSLRMPDQYDLSTVKLKLYYFDTTYATDKTNVWGVCAYATSLGDLFGTTGTEYFVTNGVLDTTNKLNIATTPAITIGGTPALGDLIHFRIRRVADNATDDAAGDSLLIGAALQYGDKRNNPAAW